MINLDEITKRPLTAAERVELVRELRARRDECALLTRDLERTLAVLDSAVRISGSKNRLIENFEGTFRMLSAKLQGEMKPSTWLEMQTMVLNILKMK